MSAILNSSPKDVTLIVPADPLAGEQVHHFRAWMERILDTVRTVVVDLSRVEYVDSAGCGALLWLHKQLLAKGGQLTISRPTPSVRAQFDLLRIERVLTIVAA